MDGQTVMAHCPHAVAGAAYAPYLENHTMGGVIAQYCEGTTRISRIPCDAA